MKQTNLDSFLLDVANQYAALTGVALSTVGKRTMNDPAFFSRLAESKTSCRTVTFEHCMDWFGKNWPEGVNMPSMTIPHDAENAA